MGSGGACGVSFSTEDARAETRPTRDTHRRRGANARDGGEHNVCIGRCCAVLWSHKVSRSDKAMSLSREVTFSCKQKKRKLSHLDLSNHLSFYFLEKIYITYMRSL